MMDRTRGSSIKLGQYYRWNRRMSCWYSTEGNMVLVFPPKNLDDKDGWWVVVPGTKQSYHFTGPSASEEALAIAAQQITTLA
jgi:hypothetical protein